MVDNKELGDKTVHDFGVQWTNYTSNDGFYGSEELFKDIVGPLLEIEEIQGAQVAEIGSGSGRIALMLAQAGAEKVTAMEPSEGYNVLVQTVSDSEWADQIETKKILGQDLDDVDTYALIFSVGVVMHIPDPVPVFQAAYTALKPGGKFFIWLYSKEGNSTYISFIRPLRAISSRLPHALLVPLIWLTYSGLVLYKILCGFLPLPLKDYITKVLWKLSPEKRRLVIYDQLNPTFVKYYTEDDVKKLFTAGGFKDIKLHHRHNYSWAATGTKIES